MRRALVNSHFCPQSVPAPGTAARRFHRTLPGYAPTPLRELPAVARELGLGALAVKDESDRLGLPAFKILGASWAVESAVLDGAVVHTLVAASAGNHGRAVARVAAQRGLLCRVLLPERALPARRQAIASEGAEVVVVEGGDYAEAVRRASEAGRQPGVLEIADVGASPAAHAVIDGYATLFAEIAEQTQAPIDVLLVPVGVGSLAAAAARFATTTRGRVVAVEPVTAACLTASLAAGFPMAVPTPGTTMAGMDCSEISSAAWHTLRDGIAGTVLVHDAEILAATEVFARAGIRVGECGAAALAGLRALVVEPAAAVLRRAVRLDQCRVVLIATEGPTSHFVPSTPPAAGAAGILI